MDDLQKAWSEVADVDKKAIHKSVIDHINYTTNRKAAYLKQRGQPGDESFNPDIVKALDSRNAAATIALKILGGELPKEEEWDDPAFD